MADLKSKLKDKLIDEYSSGTFDTLLAEIIDYDDYYNRASIIFQDPKGPGKIRLDNVPVQIGSGGVHSSAPSEGDHVWVSFANKSPLAPKIVALADERFNTNTREKLKHDRQGSTLPDSVCEMEAYPEDTDISNLGAAINDWLDEGNTNITKHMDFQNLDAYEIYVKETKNLNYYNGNEPGITHYYNGSTIKVRDSGAIDIFTATNLGIRIDPNTGTINLIGRKVNEQISVFDVVASESINFVTKRFTINGKDYSAGKYTFESM